MARSAGFAALVLLAGTALAAEPPRDYPVRPVPFTAVHLRDSFWLPRIETNRKVTIPFAFEQCEKTGRVYNFERAAAALRGEKVKDLTAPGFPFDDTDVYKVIEGAAYTLSVVKDEKLEAYIDGLVRKIGAAQEPDGYLYTTRTLNPAHPHEWAGKERWEKEEVLSHELYNLGHLYEAATAYYQATGKRPLLDIALRTADLLDKTFGPGKRAIWPGHQITEMGLVKLYRVTGDERYLKLAKFLLDSRKNGESYNQSHLPVVEQKDAVGHAVRATYMYSGIADVAALTGDESYVKAIDRLWESVAGRKLYITGGIGATARGEAFGGDYELPNMQAYNETCAAIGNDYWNQRLFLLHADAKYVDVMERTLYNGMLSGVSLDGKGFFYPNPLESAGQHQRSPWFGCACCPGNVTRFIASVPGYIYAQQGNHLYVNLYAASTADIKLDAGALKIDQETRYPWDGAIKLTVTPASATAFTIHVRIPGWARNEASAAGLYTFEDKNAEAVVLKVNGKAAPIAIEKGYVALMRKWKPGDTIELSLPMPVRRVKANDAVAADRGRVALQRGPIVYCAEWPDNPDGRVRNLVLPASAPLQSEFAPALLTGVVKITGRAVSLTAGAQGVVKKEQDFTAIPYYAWAHRGMGEMVVWLPESEAVAKPFVASIAGFSKVTASSGRNVHTVKDGQVPEAPGEWNEWVNFGWKGRGATEWIEYAFREPVRISSSSVYWVHEAPPNAGMKAPQSWRLLYRDGNDWKPVEASGAYATEPDRFNKVTFQPVMATGLRLEVVEQPNRNAGVHEWTVE